MTAPTLTTRFAPSPTGHLHLGNVRTALFNALLARHAGGVFLLRIEDTDQERSQEQYVQALLADLHWLGLDWQQGPEVGGPHGPYRQSERTEIYRHYYQVLSERDLAYPCYCTPTELALARRRQLAAGQPPRYPGTCARLTEADRRERAARGLAPTLRFRVPAGRTVAFTDQVRGEQRFQSDDIGDFIVRRADGSAQFFFCNAVDDALMGVTHVLRGEDHLANTPRQLLLLEALALPIPTYGHIPLIVGADGSPLSKRHGSRSLRELRAAGYLPEAITHYLARVGHTYERDGWLSETELATGFALERLGHAPARYDEAQLLHWQTEAVHRAEPARLRDWLGALPDVVPVARQADFLDTVRPNIRFPGEVQEWAERLFNDPLPALTDADRHWLTQAGTAFFQAALAGYEQYGADYLALIEALKARTGVRGKALFMPLRIALTGIGHGPELARLLALLPPELVRRRLQAWC